MALILIIIDFYHKIKWYITLKILKPTKKTQLDILSLICSRSELEHERNTA